ncbi:MULTISPECIES: thioredoxin domain-containing protein [Anaerolinea]|uniref:thioredoxin domain-containing protein n=1 Tax=Anaerolinea TaxID=233189 RepID=UPI00260D76A3|nr:thioredoxin domain-containing protein [Anaerolinea thermophila]
MDRTELLKKIQRHPRPVIVEFWAPWCTPCKVMEPALKQVAKEFQGKVDLWRYNADEHPELVRDLRVMGIPTLLGFNAQGEIFRRTGALPLAGLREAFTAALEGKKPEKHLSALERALRAGAGIALIIAGISLQTNWILMGLGGIVLFSAVYDRCPIVQAIKPRLEALFKKG